MTLPLAVTTLPPAALSLIGDTFDRRRIGLASAIFMLGPYLGTGIALIGGGVLLGRFNAAGGLHLPGGHVLEPWRAVFLVVACPGFVLAPLLLVFRDPRRGTSAVSQASDRPLGETLRELRTFLIPYLAGATFSGIVMFAQTAWLPTYFIRIHHFDASTIGKSIGLLYLLAGIVGSVTGGILSSRGRSEPLVRAVALMRNASIVLAISASGATLVSTPSIGLILFAISVAASSLVIAILPTPLQLIAPKDVRAQIITIGAFVMAMGSAGGGPFVVGLLTDKVFNDPLAIGKAMTLTSFVSAAIGALLLGIAKSRAKTRSAPWRE